MKINPRVIYAVRRDEIYRDFRDEEVKKRSVYALTTPGSWGESGCGRIQLNTKKEAEQAVNNYNCYADRELRKNDKLISVVFVVECRYPHLKGENFGRQ